MSHENAKSIIKLSPQTPTLMSGNRDIQSIEQLKQTPCLPSHSDGREIGKFGPKYHPKS